MSLNQFFSILRARMGVAILIMLATMAMAGGWVKLRSPGYTANAPVLVDVRTDPVGSTPLQGMVTPNYMATQVDIVKSERVAEQVVDKLPPDQQPLLRLREEAQKEGAPKVWLAHQIASKLEVKQARAR